MPGLLRIRKAPAKTLAALSLAASLAGCASLTGGLQQPRLDVINVKLLEAGLFEQRFALELNVKNPNDFELPVRGLQYTLNLAGEKFADGVTPQSFVVPAFGEARFETHVSTNLVSTIRHLSKWMEDSPRQLDYDLEGRLRVNLPFIKSIPFSESGHVDLEKTQKELKEDP